MVSAYHAVMREIEMLSREAPLRQPKANSWATSSFSSYRAQPMNDLIHFNGSIKQRKRTLPVIVGRNMACLPKKQTLLPKMPSW